MFKALLLSTKSQENDLMTFTREAPDQVAPGEVFTVTDKLQAKLRLDFAAIVATLPEGFDLQSGDLRKYQIGGVQAGDVLTNSYEVKAASQKGIYTLSASARGKPQTGESQGLTVELEITVSDQIPPPPPPPPTNKRPVADFVFSPTNPMVGDSVTLDASTSSDPDGTVENYRWNLADGTVLEGPDKEIITHAYEHAGTFQVNLVVEDDQGEASRTKSVTITVQELPPPSLFGLPIEAVIAIGAVVGGVVLYFLVRALRGSQAPPAGQAEEGTTVSDTTATVQQALDQFLIKTDLPVGKVSSIKAVEKVDPLNRAHWVRTLVNQGLIIVSVEDDTLTVKAYEDLSADEHDQVDLSPLGVESLKDFVSAHIAEGDSIMSITWVAKDGSTFESFAVVDSQGQIKYDTFMSLVPVALKN